MGSVVQFIGPSRTFRYSVRLKTCHLNQEGRSEHRRAEEVRTANPRSVGWRRRQSVPSQPRKHNSFCVGGTRVARSAELERPMVIGIADLQEQSVGLHYFRDPRAEHARLWN